MHHDHDQIIEALLQCQLEEGEEHVAITKKDLARYMKEQEDQHQNSDREEQAAEDGMYSKSVEERRGQADDENFIYKFVDCGRLQRAVRSFEKDRGGR